MRRGPRRLFLWIYLYGVGSLFVAGFASALASFAAGGWDAPWHDRAARAIAWGAERLAEHLDDPRALAADVTRLRTDLAVEATVWSADGRVLASNVAQPLAASASQRARGLVVPHGPHGLMIAEVGTGGAYVVARHAIEHGFEHFLRAGLILLAVGLGLAVAGWPLARRIAAPIEQLADAARRLGQGELGVRTGIRRRDELGRLAAAFDEMAERVQLAVRAERELLANVSHELRTPLARLRVALELEAERRDAQLPGAQRGYLADLEQDLGELERLVGEVLAVARLDHELGEVRGVPPQRRERLDLPGLLEAAATRFAAHHPGHPLSVERPGTWPEVDADPAWVRRALDNLLDNAARHGAGEVTLSVRHAGGLEIAVHDRGAGVDPLDLPRVFEAFFRGERSRTSAGVGLGLALVKRVAEAHGGSVWASNREGGGASFGLVLPVAEKPPVG